MRGLCVSLITTKSLLAGLLCVSSILAAQEYPQVGSEVVVRPRLHVAVPNLPAIKAKNDQSVAVAKAALGIALVGVKCERDSELQGVVEAYGDSSLETLSSRLAGKSCMVDSQNRRVRVTFTPNGSIQPGTLIASLVEGKPMLLRWDGHMYVLYGAVYDEHVYSSGVHDYVIRELLLIDPRYSDTRRFISFERDKDDFAQVEGVTSISASPR